MKIRLFVVGKTSHSYLSVGIDDYMRRINFYASFDIQYIADVKHAKNLTPTQQKALEGQNLMAAFDKSDHVILLDEHGKEHSSTGFATMIAKKMQTVGKRLVFVIGGPYGFSDEVYARANGQISLSKMTFPHDLIRLVFVEQLYRAFTILHNEPYHHE